MATQQSNEASENDTILINIMYTGDYTNKNIGHEIINLYKTDKGENYIYISPYGKIPDKYNKEKPIKKILLARPARKSCMEVIAIADVEKWLLGVNNGDKEESLRRYYIGQIKAKCDDKGQNFSKFNKEELNYKYVSVCLKKKAPTEQEQKDFLFKEICRDKGIAEEIIKLENIDDFENALKLEYYYKILIKEGYKEISDKFIFRNCNKILSPQQIKHLQYVFVYKQLTEKGYKDIFGLKGNAKGNKSKIDEKRSNYLQNIAEHLKEQLSVKAFEEKCKPKCENSEIKYRGGRNSKEISLDELVTLKEGISTNEKLDKYITNYENTEVPNRWKKDIFIHEYHSNLISNNITYGEQELDKIFSNNKYNDTTVHFTYKAKNIKIKNDNKESNPLYIEYELASNNENSTDKNTDIKIDKKAEICKIEGKQNTYKVIRRKLRNQSCKIYITKEDNPKFYDDLMSIINEQEKTYSKDCPQMDINDIRLNPFFLDITGNQYDELAYSNMFAHFFKKYPNYFENFAKDKLSEKDTTLKEYKRGKSFEVIREENNIDILIETDNDVFVIENKVKSKINGEKYIDKITENDETDQKDNSDNFDKTGQEYTNQLIKYYNYVESKYPDKTRHYFIFKPDYNNTKEELDDILNTKAKGNVKVKNIIKEYKHINYSDIYEFYKNIKLSDLLEKEEKEQNKNDENKKFSDIDKFVSENNQILTEYVYFNDFVKALKRHTSDTDNTIELEMEYKFSQAIKNAREDNHITTT